LEHGSPGEREGNYRLKQALHCGGPAGLPEAESCKIGIDMTMLTKASGRPHDEAPVVGAAIVPPDGFHGGGVDLAWSACERSSLVDSKSNVKKRKNIKKRVMKVRDCSASVTRTIAGSTRHLRWHSGCNV
jgi:hypothetical protein